MLVTPKAMIATRRECRHSLLFPAHVVHVDPDEERDEIEDPAITGYIPVDHLTFEMLAPQFCEEPLDREERIFADGEEFGDDPLTVLIAREEAMVSLLDSCGVDDDATQDPDSGDDLIYFGQGSRELRGMKFLLEGERGIYDRRGPRQLLARRRGSKGNFESHCPKYGRQDKRHQRPRREAKMERREAEAERQYLLWLEQAQGDFLSVSGEELEALSEEHPMYSAIEWERDELIWAWYDELAEEEEHQSQLAYEIAVLDDYEERQRQLFEGNLSLFDDLYPDWDNYDCHCRICRSLVDFCGDGLGTSSDADDVDPYDMSADYGPDDIFAYYGLEDRDVDALSVGFSSRERFTRRYPLLRGAVVSM